MFGSSIALNYYVNQAEQMRERHNDFLQRQIEQANQSRENYIGMLQNQQDTARRESERIRNQFFIQAYGMTQAAEPVEREAEAYVVVHQADAEVQECSGCLQCQANQMAHMGPRGCSYEEEEIEPPSKLTRQVAERISNDEVIVLNGNYIVCD
tara:strand:- start:44 stop:502 length:459 start_codon:yes stop_codon:yes gene_type:complete